MISSESKHSDRVWSEEYDCVPLKQRLKILLARRSFEEINRTISPEVVVKKEDIPYDKQELRIDCPPGFQAKGKYDQSNATENPVGNEEAVVTTIPKANNCDDALLQNKTSYVNTCIVEGLDAIKVKSKVADDVLDELDHIVLKERKRILLSNSIPVLSSLTRKTSRFAPRKPLGLSKHLKEGLVGQESSTEAEAKENNLFSPETLHSDSLYQSIRFPPGFPIEIPKLGESTLCGRKKINNQATLNPCLKTSTNVKVEPLDCNELQNPRNFADWTAVKSEFASTDECLEDELDHMLLRDRINLLASSDEDLDIDEYRKSIHSKKIVTSSLDYKPLRAEFDTPVTIKRTRKRKRTATDSIETALEEDAPGLLQVLVNTGVIVDEIKLYGEKESDELIDESSTEDSFSDLEAVMSKIFSQNPPFIKLPLTRCTKGEKATYCLSCLISLVEQARYLVSRKYPVEWGWCRDLQSFIFVFPRHNRIVLERPEYGYATYFFELVETFPIDWQIKRLVTAMKLSNCGRLTLLENRTLKVGEDLSEVEAKVLMNYGWIPNSGFGTMLNYRGRVVHDRKNECEISEWRSKIGKLLIEGYNSGRVVPSDFPEKFSEYFADSTPQVKLET